MMPTATVPSAKPIILAALKKAPATQTRIIERTGLHKTTLMKHIKLMRAAKEIYVCDWKPHSRRGPPMAVYAVGSLPDVPCKLPKLSKHEVYIRYRDRHANTEKEDQKKARDRLRWWENKASKVGDPLVAALFGRAPVVPMVGLE